MKREPTPTAGELAEGLRRLCPGREGDFVTALRWLYDHPREAAALCGLEEALPGGAAFRPAAGGPAGIPGPGGLAAGGGKEKSHKRKREITV